MIVFLFVFCCGVGGLFVCLVCISSSFCAEAVLRGSDPAALVALAKALPDDAIVHAEVLNCLRSITKWQVGDRAVAAAAEVAAMVAAGSSRRL